MSFNLGQWKLIWKALTLYKAVLLVTDGKNIELDNLIEQVGSEVRSIQKYGEP